MLVSDGKALKTIEELVLVKPWAIQTRLQVVWL